jgi:phosphatidylinositol alpha-1,6-mannosyltransferase
VRHLLVTNDYPPRIGGIQSYLWEIYRRLPAEETVVLTHGQRGDAAWDATQGYEIIRTRQPRLVPEPWLARRIRDVVRTREIDLVLFDPAVPVGALGPRMRLPYGVILHGAEVTVPGRIPGTRQILGDVLRGSDLVVTAGAYSTREAERAAGVQLPVAVVPPGVDTDRFRPLTASERAATRRSYGLDDGDEVVLTLSRLVPRKGMDRTIDAVAALAPSHPRLVLLVAGAGRDRSRLERRAHRLGAPVRFLDRVPDEQKPRLYGMADVFAMLCRVRWGGLEQEGFGIVFVEAAACGVPQVAGHSGGAAEAVADGVSGLVVDEPDDASAVAEAIETLLGDGDRRAAMGAASRTRAVEMFAYDALASRFHQAVSSTCSRLGGHDAELG